MAATHMLNCQEQDTADYRTRGGKLGQEMTDCRDAKLRSGLSGEPLRFCAKKGVSSSGAILWLFHVSLSVMCGAAVGTLKRRRWKSTEARIDSESLGTFRKNVAATASSGCGFPEIPFDTQQLTHVGTDSFCSL